MSNSENINFAKVEEMVEGDIDFRKELLRAMYTSIEDLKTKYIEGILGQNMETLQQARHKIKPTLSLFELNKLNAVLAEGKGIIASVGFDGLEKHLEKFSEATDNLLSDLQKVMES